MSSKKASSSPGIKIIAKNRKAFFEYEVSEQIEAGIVLVGSEVKSLRDGKLQLADAYCVFEGQQLFMLHAHIGEYSNGAYANHAPTRSRKLLLHKKELEKWLRKVDERGFTVIPLEVYFNKGRVKVKIGLCRGKAAYDKRQAIKARDERRTLRQEQDA